MSNQKGGRREGAGRKPLNHNGILIASLAREHTEAALKTLIDLMYNAEQDSVKKAAADSILDRGWGKPAQATAEMPQEEAKQVFGWLPVQK